ncbi:MAG TPA: hypothetical protein VGM30_14890 [Puia sp.]|jgi:hypothetical protein
MGYRNRKRSRNCAGFILEQLYDQAPDADMFLTEADWYGKIATLTIEEIHNQTNKYSVPELKRAIRILHSKGFIRLTDLGNPVKKDNIPKLFLTHDGKDAFLDDYYRKENQRDYLETFTLKYDLLFPLASFLFSLTAIIISILGCLHPKR